MDQTSKADVQNEPIESSPGNTLTRDENAVIDLNQEVVKEEDKKEENNQ